MDFVFFEERGVTYIVKRRDRDGVVVYRDKNHLGGPWSEAAGSVNYTGFRLSFRRRLRDAASKIDPAFLTEKKVKA